MKKIFSIIAAAGLLQIFAVSCNSMLSQDIPAPEQAAGEYGNINVELVRDGISLSKASWSNGTALDYETAVKALHLFIFNSTGDVVKHLFDDSGEMSHTVSVPVGTCTVWAIVNFDEDFSGVMTEQDLETMTFGLGDNYLIEGGSFVMSGSTSVAVTAGTTKSCTVPVKRFTSRIALVSIQNDYSADCNLVFKRAYLANVVGSANFADNVSSPVWFNPEGRKTETPVVESHIIDGTTYQASVPDLTYHDMTGASVMSGNTYTPSSPYMFYAFRNESTVGGGTFSTSFSGARTMLVVVAQLDGNTMYYPIEFTKLERNKSYAVYLKILGPGSDDPFKPVVKSSLEVKVTIDPWADGGSLNPEI